MTSKSGVMEDLMGDCFARGASLAMTCKSRRREIWIQELYF
jgi:hypothetical protein